MNRNKLKTLSVVLLLLSTLCTGASSRVFRRAQGNGDYLNEQEVDRIREAQEIELRTQVFIFIANRRLKIITGELKQQTKKEEELWGPLPKGTTTELLDGYRRAIAELMEKIDDTYQRNPKVEGFKKALKRIADGTDLQLKTLAALKGTLKEDDALRTLAGAIEVAKTANDGAKEALKQP